MSYYRCMVILSPWSCPHNSSDTWHWGEWIFFSLAQLIVSLPPVDTKRLSKQNYWPCGWSFNGWPIKNRLSAEFNYFAVWSALCMGQLWIWSWSKCKFYFLKFFIYTDRNYPEQLSNHLLYKWEWRFSWFASQTGSYLWFNNLPTWWVVYWPFQAGYF